MGSNGRRTLTATPPAPAIEGLTCPSDPPEIPAEPWLAYVGNAGQAIFGHDAPAATATEYAANGVFFDDNRIRISDLPTAAAMARDESAAVSADSDVARLHLVGRRHQQDDDAFGKHCTRSTGAYDVQNYDQDDTAD